MNIEDYGERIFNSNSHVELFHLYDYIMIVHHLTDDEAGRFGAWFEGAVKFAEENWDRPESVFQHIPRMMSDSANA